MDKSEEIVKQLASWIADKESKEKIISKLGKHLKDELIGALWLLAEKDVVAATGEENSNIEKNSSANLPSLPGQANEMGPEDSMSVSPSLPSNDASGLGDDEDTLKKLEKSQVKVRVCKTRFRGKVCNRGDSCKYKHPPMCTNKECSAQRQPGCTDWHFKPKQPGNGARRRNDAAHPSAKTMRATKPDKQNGTNHATRSVQARPVRSGGNEVAALQEKVKVARLKEELRRLGHEQKPPLGPGTGPGASYAMVASPQQAKVGPPLPPAPQQGTQVLIAALMAVLESFRA